MGTAAQVSVMCVSRVGYYLTYGSKSLTLDEYRNEIEKSSNRSVSMPIAGTIVWGLIALLSTQFDETIALYILLFATGGILPLALVIAKIRTENLVSSSNLFAKLMGLCILMVNLLWAVHIPLLLNAPKIRPFKLRRWARTTLGSLFMDRQKSVGFNSCTIEESINRFSLVFIP
jgi:hypothetical protein